MRASQLSFWSLAGGEQGLGNAALLDQPLTAFFASRQSPGVAIRETMNWAIEQARGKHPVISGFHSPLEQSVLEVLLAAGAPCVMVIARKLEAARLPPTWIRAAEGGAAAVVGIEAATPRLTAELAARRNDWIANRCSRIVVAAISPAGGLVRQVERWSEAGRLVDYLGSGLPDR